MEVSMNSKNKVMKEVISWIFTIIGGLLIVLVFNSKVYASAQVKQSSMENTLFSQQKLFVDKFSSNFSDPQRGDIIIFLEDEYKGTIIDESVRTIEDIVYKITTKNTEENELHSRLVKRVIGIAGDEVDIKDGYVYVNGEKLDEPYVKGETEEHEFELPTVVGKNQLFVLGDNRAVSIDSRSFGLIDCRQVEGKAVFRIYPFNKIGKIE